MSLYNDNNSIDCFDGSIVSSIINTHGTFRPCILQSPGPGKFFSKYNRLKHSKINYFLAMVLYLKYGTVLKFNSIELFRTNRFCYSWYVNVQSMVP